MENSPKTAFQHSLDLTSEELEAYVPELLKGLWELGSMPEYIIKIFESNHLGNDMLITDLGCGKGAVLVKLAEHFEIKSAGIDLVTDFIEEANKYAIDLGVSEKLTFQTADITEAIKTITNQDMVIYGYDAEILGDLECTLNHLKNCIKADGYILLEFMFADKVSEDLVTEPVMKDIITQSGFQILDRINWNRETLKQINRKNTAIIQENVNRLILQYPDKQEVFNEYLLNQIEECEALENEYFCTTLLLRQSDL
jgi:cyclopropane fatty-acyl-phospholipid synthase-like methyltransferase